MNEPIDPGRPPVAPPAAPPSALQFDRAEIEEDPRESQAPACAFCETPLRSSYFDINGRMACESCRFQLEEQIRKGPGAAGFFRACGVGVAAAIAGSGIYYAVRALTGYEIGLISILVGLMVGKAVSWGSRRRGGWVYQTLAMFLTYMAIASTYIPPLIQQFREQAKVGGKVASAGPVDSAPGSAAKPDAKSAEPEGTSSISVGKAILAILALFALAAAVPFLAGFENVIGLLIIAFGLWEAWKLNKRPKIEILGPLDLGAAPSPVPASS